MRRERREQEIHIRQKQEKEKREKTAKIRRSSCSLSGLLSPRINQWRRRRTEEGDKTRVNPENWRGRKDCSAKELFSQVSRAKETGEHRLFTESV